MKEVFIIGKFKDRTNEIVGRLRVIERVDNYKDKNGVRRTIWKCLCECGNIVNVRSDCLNEKHTMSCGCYHKEQARKSGKIAGKKFVKYGDSSSRLYNIWYLMNYRCNNPNSPAYKNYGGRGIQVCDDWKDDNGYINFKLWALNSGYNETLTIDRIDNKLNYCPENCRWTTYTVQSNNKRSNVRLEYNGEIKTAREWADEYNIRYKTLMQRLYRGLSIEEALTKPIRKSHV